MISYVDIGFAIIIIVSHSFLVDIFEFFLFTGEYKTHKFKERIYPKKYSWMKRALMLTYYDNDLIHNCKYKKQMRAIIISDRIYLVVSLIIIIIKINGVIFNFELLFLDVFEKSLLALSLVFDEWVTIKSIRWKEWIKGNWRSGQFEFQIRLPEDKEK